GAMKMGSFERREAEAILRLWQSLRYNSRRPLARSKNSVRGSLKIRFLRTIDVGERLRIAIDQRKPGALYLHHDFMTAAKGVINVFQLVLDRSWHVWLEGLRILKTVAELAAHYVAAHQLLMPAHPHAGWIGIRIGIVVWINVNQLHNPIRVGAAG